MKALKMYFVLVYLLGLLTASLHSLLVLLLDNFLNYAWLGACLATLPSLLFILKLGITQKTSTNSSMVVPISLAIIGCIITLIHFSVLPVFYSLVIGLVGGLLYHFWYSVLNHNNGLKPLVGKPFPPFEIATVEKGERFSNEQLIGVNSLLIFYRGNWCPLCVAQIRDIARQYQTLTNLGTQLVFISPQNAEESQKIARKFAIQARFAIDQHFILSDTLNITHHSAVPPIFSKGQTDTVFPTVIITDKQGIIRWVDQTDNYRARPEPKQFLTLIASLDD